MIDKYNYKSEEQPENKPVTYDKVPKDLQPNPAGVCIPAELAQAAAKAVRAKEYEAVFNNPKIARKMWRNIGLAIAMRPATKPAVQLDKNDNETFESAVQRYTYDKLMKDVDNLLFGNEGPTEMEMIMACQAVIARTNPSAFAAFLDRTGGKPIDESKLDAQVTNPYETLSDEELEMIAEMRARKAAQQENN